MGVLDFSSVGFLKDGCLLLDSFVGWLSLLDFPMAISNQSMAFSVSPAFS